MTGRRKTKAPAGPTVQEFIRQTKPFRSRQQEALITLLLTAEAVHGRFSDLFDAHGELTHQQYNVLRILRGAQPNGLPTLEIGQRMIERTPGVTRLIDRLETKGLVKRQRDRDDRRVVHCRLTPEGSALLSSLDAPVDRLDDQLLDCLGERELSTLLELLNRVRLHLHGQRPPASA